MKTVTIEELLTWTFVDELPKGGGVDGLDNANSAWRMLQASSWGKINSFAELLTLVDTGPRDSDNFFIEQGAPHDDALAVGEAVADLAFCDVAIPANWYPLGDWPHDDQVAALAAQSVTTVVERFSLRPARRRAAGVVSTVIGVAILRREPDWSAPLPKIRMVERRGRPAWFAKRTLKDVFGKPYEIEVDGYNRRTHRRLPEAYRKYEFSADPAGDILSRLDYQIWVAALRRLEDRLRTQLGSHRLLHSDRSMTPWLDEDRPGVELRENTGRKNSARAA
jgi:hypothetical protein